MRRQSVGMASAWTCLRPKNRANAALLAAMLLTVAAPALAQDIEPRAFSNAPTGVNFLIGGYTFTRGGLSFDTAVPITDAQLNTSSAVLAYARELDLLGMSAKFDAITPYTWLSGTAKLAGLPVEMYSRWARRRSIPTVRQLLRCAGTNGTRICCVPAGSNPRGERAGLGAHRPVRLEPCNKPRD